MWRKSITQAKYKDAQESIRKNLFLLNSVLQKALLEMREMCLKLLDINFFDTSSLQLSPLFYFIENQVMFILIPFYIQCLGECFYLHITKFQMHKKESIQAQVEDYRSRFKEIINTACHGALFEEGFSPQDSNMRLSRIQLR